MSGGGNNSLMVSSLKVSNDAFTNGLGVPAYNNDNKYNYGSKYNFN